MNSLSPDMQKMIAEYRELLAQALEREKQLQEDNALLVKSLANSDLLPEVALSSDPNAWYRECMIMRSSLSWRITKPLRVLKKVISSLKNGGLKLTFQKIKRHLVK